MPHTLVTSWLAAPGTIVIMHVLLCRIQPSFSHRSASHLNRFCTSSNRAIEIDVMLLDDHAEGAVAHRWMVRSKELENNRCDRALLATRAEWKKWNFCWFVGEIKDHQLE